MTRQRRADVTYQRILDCAETLFARQGFSATSTRQIAAEAGISIQTLHYHFAGKKNLYNRVMERSVVPVTDLVNKHVQEMFRQDLNDAGRLELAVTRIIDELFDILHSHPNYPLLFYRQWLEPDPELRNVEMENLTPVLQEWAQEIESQLGEERLRGMNLILFFLTLSWMYWGMFVQPNFVGRLVGIDPGSAEFLAMAKDHAREMSMRMMEQRGSSLLSKTIEEIKIAERS